ncbi:MAG: DNA modification methylase [Thermomicrobiales bacterium]
MDRDAANAGADRPEANGATTELATLLLDPRNARTHSERNLALIEQALREVGAARSIVVDEAGTILAGNATVAAATQAGLTHVRFVEADGTELVAVRRTGLSPEQKRRLALLDNRAAELADWDTAILAALAEDTDLSGLWSDDEIAALMAREPAPVTPLTDPDSLPEVLDDPITTPGDLWLLGRHRLLCGDATNAEDVRRLMAGARAPLMPTDPPYLVNYQGGNHPQSWSNRPVVKDKHWDDYREGDGAAFFSAFLRVALDEALTATPALYQFHASARQALVEEAWKQNGLLVHQQLIWVKNRAILTHSHFMWQHETCFYGWVQGTPPRRTPPANATTVWTVAPAGGESASPVAETDAASGLHPTQKPVALIRRMVEYHTLPGEAVYEPFAGSGTALITCELTGRVCHALELAPAYCDVVVRRWEQLTGQQAVRAAAETGAPDRTADAA